ncbi:hypothetical protein ACFWBI_21430 [Streptomyces sp. NPDC059982]|uniref:hypothetical protein n=1 Tax=unclassified Streptomyces TaxID=2593676 RepID=UPI003697AE96
MPVYEYHPDELARTSVVRQATGLTLREVEERRRAAQDREDRALDAPEEPGRPSELGIASSQTLEWKRIAHVMTEQRMPVYCPAEDRRVARREEQRVQRKATEGGWSEQSGGGMPLEVLRHRVYRITARATAAGTAGDTWVRHLFAASADAAVEHARRMFSRPGSIYQDGEYRITSVKQILPESGDFF